MAKFKINNIENVEGDYHLMFFEGKNTIAYAKSELRNAFFVLLLFIALVIVFIVFSSINKFYFYFAFVFLIAFVVTVAWLLLLKHRGKKQCIYAVRKSNSNDVIPKERSSYSTGKAIVKSMSSTIDKYDTKNKFPGFFKKLKRRRKHKQIVERITDFEKEK